MTEEKAINLTIDSDPQTRKGAYSDRVLVTSEGGFIRLDFLHVDIPSDDGMRAVLVSRIMMSREDVVALKDVLDSHLSMTSRSPEDAEC